MRPLAGLRVVCSAVALVEIRNLWDQRVRWIGIREQTQNAQKHLGD